VAPFEVDDRGGGRCEVITDPTSKGAQELEAKSADMVRIVQVPRPAPPHPTTPGASPILCTHGHGCCAPPAMSARADASYATKPNCHAHKIPDTMRAYQSHQKRAVAARMRS
jgi:hypothetical protein